METTIKFIFLLLLGISGVLITESSIEGKCLATQNGIGEPRVLAVRNNTQLTVEVPYFYNGCEGNNVTLVACLLDLHQRGSTALSERVQIAHTLGANKVNVKLHTPAMPIDGQSYKIMIVMTAQLQGNTAKLISQKKFEYRPKRIIRSDTMDEFQGNNQERTGENRYETAAPSTGQFLKEKKPDLCILSVLQQPPNVVPKSKRIFFEVKIGNNGDGPCKSAFRLKGPDGVQGSIDPLAPGQTQAVRLPFIFRASGPGRTTIDGIYFQVDPDNLISESNETNNSAGPFRVILD